MVKETTSNKLLPLKPGVVEVDTWCQKFDENNREYWDEPEADRYFKYSDKTIKIEFEKYFNTANVRYLDIFYILYKDSYVKKLDLITHYLNYFLKFYDPDKELLMSYFYIKYLLDLKETKMSRKQFISLMYQMFITDSLYDKIKNMVEDNYRIDLSQDPDKKIKYNEALEFTNEHAKLLMIISILIKMMIPLTIHYISINKDKNEIHNLVHYFKPLFSLIEEKEHVNLYGKLYNSIAVKVNLSESKNKLIWDKYEVESFDGATYTDELLDKNCIVDNIFKYRFDNNIIAFNSVILKTQLDFYVVKNLNINLREISTEKDSDGLSSLDMLEMNANKIDESIIILSQINIKKTIKTIKKRMNIELSKDEVNYYMRNTRVSSIAKTLVFDYYAKFFGGYRDLNMLNLRLYMKLMILLKKELELRGCVYLNQIISANINGRVNTRTIRNSKFIDKIQSSTYKKLVENKYPKLQSGGKNSDIIISLLSTLINTQFTFVDYDNPDMLGEEIEVNLDVLSQEFLDFVNRI